MQSKETGDVVGLIHRVRKKYYHYKVAMAEFEDMQRKDAAQRREAEDPTLVEEMSRKAPSRGTMPAIDKKKGKKSGAPKIASLTEPQKIRDEIKILCKTLHNIPAVRENEALYVHEDIPKILEEVLMDEVAGVGTHAA